MGLSGLTDGLIGASMHAPAVLGTHLSILAFGPVNIVVRFLGGIVKNNVPIYVKTAVDAVVQFAGKSGSNRGPILVVTGSRSSAEVIVFLNAVLDEMMVGDRIRCFTSPFQLGSYIDGDTNPDPVFYRENGGWPSASVQKLIAEICDNEMRRWRLPPLLLVAVEHFPSAHPKPEIPGYALVREFQEKIRTRIVDISSSAEASASRRTSPESLMRLFLTVLSRKNGPTTDRDAEQLIQHALDREATTCPETVIKLATRARKRAAEMRLALVTSKLLWEVFPPNFREVVRPSDAVAS